MTYRGRIVAAAVVATIGLALGSSVEAGGSRLSIATTGPVETVFDWSRDACTRTNVPDASARAFRSADGETRVVVSHNDNRALVGKSLDAVRPDCSLLFEAGRSAKLAEFDDLSWIGGVYTANGREVYALAHTEMRGDRTPGQCPAGRYSPCLLNTVTALVSRDGGRSFQAEKSEGRPPVVATLPYGFPTDRNARVGYSNPSNIFMREGWYYAFIFADGYRAQRRGNCLIRTRTLDDPSSWRAWDGKDFAATFVDPFRNEIEDVAAHVCAPVAPNLLGRMIGGVVKHPDTGAFIAVFGDKRRNRDGRTVEGFFTATSSDLLQWSEPSLVMEAQLLWNKSCGDEHSYFYPTLIDPAARTPSFEDFGRSGFLYLTRYQLKNCKVTWDRDLVRVPVAISEQP